MEDLSPLKESPLQNVYQNPSQRLTPEGHNVTLGCFMVVTFLIFSQGDWLFDIFMGVEIHD